MTEQQEIKLKNFITKHSTRVGDFYYISNTFDPEKGGYSQLDELVQDIHKLYTVE
jgi:hypothetical protein